MSYEKNTWQKGDVITALKLNHMEDGIAGAGVLVVNEVYDEQTDTLSLDHTWQEIYNAGTAVVKSEEEDSFSLAWLINISKINITYRCAFLGSEVSDYKTDRPDGYPVLQDS